MKRFLLPSLLALFVAACSGGSSTPPASGGDGGDTNTDSATDAGADTANACPNLTPDDCTDPDAAPSFKTDITPIVQQKCVPCHGPGGVESTIPYTTYRGVQKEAPGIQQRVAFCIMPPVDAGSGPLDDMQRTTLLTWLVCGAPNN